MNKIVILGAGYAGIRATKILGKKAEEAKDISITLINKNEYHYETTELAQVAAGTLSGDKVIYDLNKLGKKINLIVDEVVSIDTDKKTVMLKNAKPIDYDYLIIALGFVSSDLNVPGVKENTFAIEDLNSSLRISEHIRECLLNYKTSKNEAELNIAVAGAGFTGVEFLGELASELDKLKEEYNVPFIKVSCIQSTDRILPMFDEKLATYAQSFLTKKGIEIILNARVTEVKDGEVIYTPKDQPAKSIKANSIIWTVGVCGSPVITASNLPQKRNRVAVDADLRVPDLKNVFCIGDSSAVKNLETDQFYPATAQISIKQGEHAAKNVIRLIKGESTQKFTFKSLGTVGSLGDSDAIAEMASGKIKIQGRPASILKKMIENRSLLKESDISTMFEKGRFDLYH